MIPKLVGHRGYMGKYPENSLLGLETALKAGACMVEFDVQMNADHEFMVLHDSDLLRTASVVGSVFDLTTSDFRKISAHEPERFGDRFLKTPVPTLKDVMELVTNYSKATAFVEMKDESLSKWGLEQVMDALINELKPYASQCVVISFNYSAVQYVKNKKAYPIGWVLKTFDEASRQTAGELEPEYLICNHTKILDEDELWQGSWSWMLYDIVNPKLAMHWAQRGVELIETEDIGGMLGHEELHKESC